MVNNIKVTPIDFDLNFCVHKKVSRIERVQFLIPEFLWKFIDVQN